MLKPAEISDGLTPIKLITTEDTRFFHCNIKTLNLIPLCHGCSESQRGRLSGVCILPSGRTRHRMRSQQRSYFKDGVLYTAPTDHLILPGIARAHLIRMCKSLGVPVSETPYTLKELFDADEVIVTSSSNLCLRACQIDGKPVGGKAPELMEKIRSSLLEEFYEVTRKQVS